MATELDNAMTRIMRGLTSPGAPFETVSVRNRGVDMPAFKNAPPSLAAYFGHYCQEHKDKVFLVDGDARITFGEFYAASRKVAQGLIARYKVEKGTGSGSRRAIPPIGRSFTAAS